MLFGLVRIILHAEQRHIDALLPLFDRYALTPPLDRWSGLITPPATLRQACEAGIAGEIRNYQMYEAFLTQIAEPDVRAVFMSLRNASAERHLPAFKSCAIGQAAPAVARPASALLPPKAYLPSGTTPLWLGVAVGAGLVWWLSRR